MPKIKKKNSEKIDRRSDRDNVGTSYYTLITVRKYTTAAITTDALNLGPHWIYDQEVLIKEFPNGLVELRDPLSSYHPNRRAGQLTHIGDQVAYLQQSIEMQGGYNHQHWRNYWVSKMSAYDGYLDSATKEVLSREGREASQSEEFSVLSRIAPILDLDIGVEEKVDFAQQQAGLTHGGPVILDGVAFFVRVIDHISKGNTIREAFEIEADNERYPILKPARAMAKAEQQAAEDYLQVAQAFGQACSFSAAFPLTLYFALHHSEDYTHCMKVNALAGGDTTARAIILAMLIVAREGGIGDSLLKELKF